MREIDLSKASRAELREWAELIPNLVRLVSGLVRDRRVPWKHKAVLAGAVAYVLSPVDAIPGWIPALGQLDDLALLAFALRAILAEVDQEIVLSHWRGNADLLEFVQAVTERATQWLPQEALDWLGSKSKGVIDGTARPDDF